MRPLFVYGLLRPGFAGFAELNLSAAVHVLGSDSVAGSLYDLGDYPGMTLDGRGVVHGELIAPYDDTVLERLDAYEGYYPADPDCSEYIRVTTTTLQRKLAVDVYIYNRPLTHARRLAHGMWGIAR